MTKAYMIVDLQFGSTGKGLIAGFLAEQYRPDISVAAWGPNAGHTYIDQYGKKTIATMIPIGAERSASAMIGPGAAIDKDAFFAEMAIRNLSAKKIFIHERAAVVTDEHRKEEAGLVRIGSTMKGNAEALIAKMRRSRTLAQDDHDLQPFTITANDYRNRMAEAQTIAIEGAQGYSLSINHGMYPYVTSRDTTPYQVMADCGIPYGLCRPKVVGTMRTFPIRVANRYNGAGEQIGTSGPFYPDQFELSWEELQVPVELTTVTKLPRRVFTFSDIQVAEAKMHMNPDAVFLNFTNYLQSIPNNNVVMYWVRRMENLGLKVCWTGDGPTFRNVHPVANKEFTLD